MSQIAPITVNVDELIAVNKYEVDEESAHIELVEDPDIEEFKKLVRVCPAALYKIAEDGSTSFDYAGCLELRLKYFGFGAGLYRFVPAIQSRAGYSTTPSWRSSSRAIVMRWMVGEPSSSHSARQSR